ncbi:MAG: hypothetical protein M3417_08955, partial [Actinomycetota bacterium]|nr:hypothetical protein [Actinomycetota bacterium]
MQVLRPRSPTVIALACLAAIVAWPAQALANPGDITQPCRTASSPPDWELQRLARWMSTTTSTGPNPQTRVGAFDVVRADLGAQAGDVGLDNMRGTFYVRFSPGPLDAAAVHERFVRAVERTAPAEDVQAIRPRLRVVAQQYPQTELRSLQRGLFDRIRAERPDVAIGGSVGCRESDDVRVEIDLYSGASEEAAAAVDRIVAEYGDRVVLTRRPYGPPSPAIGRPAPLPAPPPMPSPTPSPAPALTPLPLPRLSEVL